MDTRNCCSGCSGINDVYYCSNPIRRATVTPSHTCVAQPVAVAVKEESVSRGNAAVEAMPRAVKEEKSVNLGNGVVEAMPKGTVFVKKEAVKVDA